MTMTFPDSQKKECFSTLFSGKCFCLVFFFFIINVSDAQVKAGHDSIAVLLKLSPEQKVKILEIDKQTLNDMDGMRGRAETGYNPPGDIQYQHKFIIIRRLQALESFLSPEQYQKMINLRFDISPDSKWFAAFYKKHKLPTIEQAVAKKQKQVQPKMNKQ